MSGGRGQWEKKEKKGKSRSEVKKSRKRGREGMGAEVDHLSACFRRNRSPR